MKEYSLLFTSEMYRLTASGQKNMTRRLSDVWARRKVGDRLWVKERFWRFGRHVKIGKTKTGKQAYRFDIAFDPRMKSYRFDDPDVVTPKKRIRLASFLTFIYAKTCFPSLA